MRRRLIISNALMVFFALLLLLAASLITIVTINNNSSKEELNNYLNITCEVFNGDNYDETARIITKSNQNLRVTIIDFDGNVIIDTSVSEELESHLDRPEIKDLGTPYLRYSSTLKMQMLYLATIDDGFYVRVAIPLHSINSIVNLYSLIGLASFVIIMLLSIMISTSISKKTLEPLNQVINQLGSIVNTKNYYGIDSIETLIEEINDIKMQINEKIVTIKNEKDKLDYIINNMNQGIIVINDHKNVILINDFAMDILNFSQEEVINKNYLYLIRKTEIQEKIEAAFLRQEVKNIDFNINGRTYVVRFNLTQNSWLGTGVVLTIIDVTEQKNIERIKREFFANASHELKSPLTTIIGYQQMISEGIVTDEVAIKEATTKTIKEATRMNRIIVEMLELSKLESNFHPKLESVAINKIINEIIEDYQKLLLEKNISLKVNLDDVNLTMDYNHAFEMIRNLIDNAIKYNNNRGELEILLTPQKLTITDTGIGIALEDQLKIFERFYRVDKGKSKEMGGTGLGLAIVKHICSLYDFKINLQSEIDKGTTIEIIFPKKAV